MAASSASAMAIQNFDAVDLQKKTDDELVLLQAHPNDWYARHARRILQERAHSRILDVNARERMVELLNPDNTKTRGLLPSFGEPVKIETIELRALWTLHDTGYLDDRGTRQKFHAPQS